MNKVPNYDVFGYCVNCGKHMLTHEVIDGVYQTRLSGEYTTVRYILDDESSMRVAMCKSCANTIDGSETERVMGKVYRGWQHEIETYANWDEEKKKNYFKMYSKRKIITRTDNKPSDMVKKEVNKFKKKEKK